MRVVSEPVRRWFVVLDKEHREYRRSIDAYRKAAFNLVSEERCGKCQGWEPGCAFDMYAANHYSKMGSPCACSGKPLSCEDCRYYSYGPYAKRLLKRLVQIMQRSDAIEKDRERINAKRLASYHAQQAEIERLAAEYRARKGAQQ